MLDKASQASCLACNIVFLRLQQVNKSNYMQNNNEKKFNQIWIFLNIKNPFKMLG